MEKLEKFKDFSLKKADATADIQLINQYSVKELTPDDVYCFSVILCDNDVDRDLERFTGKTLDQLAVLFVGKTGISDHRWSSDRQIARLYRAEVETTTEKNALGAPLKRLVGSAYMLKTESTRPIIEAIEGGIIKEVSIGCSVSKQSCSICGEPFSLDWRDWTYKCKNNHIKGETYDGSQCVCNLDDPSDAYEFSFVAVPAQKNAGVTKSAKDLDAAFATLMAADLSKHSAEIKSLLPRIQTALEDAADREARAKILKENEKYLTK